MKGFKVFLLVTFLVICIVVGVVYFIDTPVVEEGVEPTVAQKIIIAAKEKLNVILSALGVSAVALIAFFFRKVVACSTDINSATSLTATKLDDFIAKLKTENAERLAENIALKKNVDVLTKQVDTLSSTLFEVFLLSDLPVSVRDKISRSKTLFEELTSQPAVEADPVREDAKDVSETVVHPAEDAQANDDAASAAYFN